MTKKELIEKLNNINNNLEITITDYNGNNYLLEDIKLDNNKIIFQ